MNSNANDSSATESILRLSTKIQLPHRDSTHNGARVWTFIDFWLENHSKWKESPGAAFDAGTSLWPACTMHLCLVNRYRSLVTGTAVWYRLPSSRYSNLGSHPTETSRATHGLAIHNFWRSCSETFICSLSVDLKRLNPVVAESLSTSVSSNLITRFYIGW